MMVYSTTIGEIYTHIHESIAGQICRKMLKQLGLTDYFKNHLYFNSEVEGPSRSYSEVRLPILHENAFKCNIKYSTNPFGIKWDSTTPGQHLDPALHRRDALKTYPIFYDVEHGIELTERYLPCNIELSCQMTFVDRVVAFDVMNRICATYVRGELMMVNDLSYDYRMPPEILNRLYTIGTMLNLPKGTYLDWLTKCSNKQIQRIVSQRQNNRHAEIVIKKQQFGTLAAIDYNPDSPDFASLGTSMDTVTLNFTITAQFGRVNMLYLKYPIIINNKLVPENLVTADPIDAYGSLYKYLQHPYMVINQGYQWLKDLYAHPARNPWYDDWNIPDHCSIVADYARPFFIGAFTLDSTECGNENCHCCCCKDCGHKYTEINIATDLDQYKLTPDVLQWFKDNPDKALNTESKYSLTVFKNTSQIDPSLLQFDGTTLKFPNCKGPNFIYRLVISASTRTFSDGCPWNSLMLVFDIDVDPETIIS